MCSLHLTHPSAHTHLEQCAADAAAPGEQLWDQGLAQGSHLSHGQFLLEPRFEPTTSGYKSNALSIRPGLVYFTYMKKSSIKILQKYIQNIKCYYDRFVIFGGTLSFYE